MISDLRHSFDTLRTLFRSTARPTLSSLLIHRSGLLPLSRGRSFVSQGGLWNTLLFILCHEYAYPLSNVVPGSIYRGFQSQLISLIVMPYEVINIDLLPIKRLY